MGHRGSKAFQLLIAGSEFDIACSQTHVQNFDFVLCALASRNIANSARDQGSILGFERAETDLGWEFRAVFALSEQFQPGVHGAYLGLAKEVGHLSGMVAAEALRHQNFHGLIEQLFSLISE